MIPEELQKELLDKFPLKYDIRVFELFPIDIKISVINNYRIIFGNALGISEYFDLFGKSGRIVTIVSYQTNFQVIMSEYHIKNDYLRITLKFLFN